HSFIGRLVLQRGLHGHSRDAHDLDPALLRLLLAACARRAHPDATVAQRHWSDGGALLGYRRGQKPTVTGRGGVTTAWGKRRLSISTACAGCGAQCATPAVRRALGSNKLPPHLSEYLAATSMWRISSGRVMMGLDCPSFSR